MASELQPQPSPRIDVLDLHILDVLLANARASLRQISNRVGLASTAVSNRIDALEEQGVIQGYVPHLNYSALGFEKAAVFQIRADYGAIDPIAAQIEMYPTVTDLFSTTGEYDVLAIAHTPDTNSIRIQKREFSSLKGVDRVTANIVLEPYSFHQPVRRLSDGCSLLESSLRSRPDPET